METVTTPRSDYSEVQGEVYLGMNFRIKEV